MFHTFKNTIGVFVIAPLSTILYYFYKSFKFIVFICFHESDKSVKMELENNHFNYITMTSISHYPHSLNTKYYTVLLYRNSNPISFVCRKHKCSNTSLMRWNKKFDGSKKSLIYKSHKPLSPHPNSYTEKELYWIKNYIRRDSNISLCELYGKLRTEKVILDTPALYLESLVN